MRLRRVRRGDLTLSRVRRGRGFAYLDADGRPVADLETRQRIIDLAIPPAWSEVRIAAHPRAHIQAFGIDAAGRGQYIYHAEWERRRTARKQDRLAALAEALPAIRRRIARDLHAEAGSPALALAIGLALIDRTGMRVGRERYLEANGTRGAGTLYARDAQVEGDEVCLSFAAKGGKAARYCLTDALLADAVARIKTLPGRRLLVYRDEAGAVRPIRTEMLNAALREAAGADVSAKDFRTLHASALAAEALAALEPGASPSARKRQVAKVVRNVADYLRNTPAICRASYVAPCLFTLFEQDRLRALWAEPVEARAGLKQRERRLGVVLSAIA